MRLVNFNAQSGRADQSWGGAVLGDDAMNDAAVREAAAEIAQFKPGVLALQEVREDCGQSILPVFAESAGMEHRRFAMCRRASSNFIARMFRCSRRGCETAFATTHPIDHIRALRLSSWRNPMHRASDRHLGWCFRLEEQRMAIVTVLLTPKPVVVGATYLTMKQPDNRKQPHRLRDFMTGVVRRRGTPDAPRIVLGDLNTHLEDIQKQAEHEALAQTLTYPDDEPNFQIDHILGVGFRTAEEATTRRLTVPDHRMLAVDAD